MGLRKVLPMDSVARNGAVLRVVGGPDGWPGGIVPEVVRVEVERYEDGTEQERWLLYKYDEDDVVGKDGRLRLEGLQKGDRGHYFAVVAIPIGHVLSEHSSRALAPGVIP
jgi:hypothetical protein